MEWAFRMLQEPDRLWKRYMTTTPLYVYRLLRHYEPV
jgi:UDP-N-acetyl-D-mannosaminuronic acid transferase (WecB/TagA/CpsF family)